MKGGEKMKAIILVFAVMAFVMLGVVGVIGANTQEQAAQVIVTQSIDITISPCANPLSFGSLTPNTVNQPVTCQDLDTSTYAVAITNGGTSTINLAVKANNANFVSGGYNFAVGNAVWDDDFTATDGTPMTTSDVQFAGGVAPGVVEDINFWLSVPISQHSGTYTNTFTFTSSEA
jgi:hypothetical protein